MNLPLLLTMLAASATLIGGLVATLQKKPSNRIIALSLGFAAGIMLMVALTEMLPVSINGGGKNTVYGYIAFILGLLGFYGIDACLPHEQPSDMDLVNPPKGLSFGSENKQLKNTAMMLMIGITLHNFPEGFATFISASHDLELGIGVALAVSIHNLPEGLAVAAPIYLATGSKGKAILWAGLSGCSEFLGGMLAFLFWGNAIPIESLDIIMAGVAGIMVAISIDELMPLSKEIHPETNPSIGVFLGMAVMGLSLVLLKVAHVN